TTRAALDGDRQAAPYHIGIVDAAPEVAAIGHVTVLALDAVAREAARLPFHVRVLEQLAVQRKSLARELMTPATEPGGEERGRATPGPIACACRLVRQPASCSG